MGAAVASAEPSATADVLTAGGTAYRQIAAWWLGSRILVLVTALAVQLVGFSRLHWRPSVFRHPLAVLAMWDGRWYRAVAQHGYLLLPGRQSDPAFFPLLPVIERGFAALGVPYVVAGVVVANLAFAVGLAAFYELGRQLLPEQDARRAALYLAIFPIGYVFSMAYPESIAFAAISLAGLFAVRRRWLACAVCAALATLARPEGIFLVLPLGAIVVRRWAWMPFWDRARAVAAVCSPPLALASFSLYLWRTLGDPLAWSKAERAWGRTFQLAGLYHAAVQLSSVARDHNDWLLRDAGFCVVYLLLLVAALRAGVPWSWVLGAAAIVILPLESRSVTSDARFGLLALPAFWGLAYVGRGRVLRLLIPALSVPLLAAAVSTIPFHYP